MTTKVSKKAVEFQKAKQKEIRKNNPKNPRKKVKK